MKQSYSSARADFKAWVENENVFTNTLVDRINTGYPKGEELNLEYEDNMVNTSEYFHLWVIETDFDIEKELPFSKANLNSISKFKVRVLPSILEYNKRFGKLSETLTFAFAKLIEFYRTDMTNDAPDVVEFMKTASVKDILAKTEYWGDDLSFMCREIEKYSL